MEEPSTTLSPEVQFCNNPHSPETAELSSIVVSSDLESRNKFERGIAEAIAERASLRDRIRRLETNLREKEEEFSRKFDEEIGDYRERVQKLESEREERNLLMVRSLESLSTIRDCLSRVLEGLEEANDEISVRESEEEEVCVVKSRPGEEEARALMEEAWMVSRLAVEVETRIDKYKESKKKEKKELDNSLISLTEENRDVNKLLRIALLEKEAMEKKNQEETDNDSLGGNILGLPERCSVRIRFNFKNDYSCCSGAFRGVCGGTQGVIRLLECRVCLGMLPTVASTVERIMKNLRLEITQLRKSLEESRSDTERLQCLTDKQAKEIAENKLYIKELEDRERVLAQNVEELLMEIKETEEEVARWKNACELEVEAGKNEIEERDKVVAALKQELQKTKASLDIANGKLKLKEELANSAMAAQAAAERSLQLADSRAVELRQRMEELTRHLEEAEKRERNSRKVRHKCWPWQFFKLSTRATTSNTRVGNVKRLLPEMQALLH
ncbi:putative ATP-binding protein [Senna tora]|uniref:Putative ATP-binding protein n=1 Tax=Senna tora TaxID=362788 RepID=A0A834WJR6_9FABA|nr:putative ATP-binding protein [Senna tora]